MLAATQDSATYTDSLRSLGRVALIGAGILALAALAATPAASVERAPTRQDGLYISVPNPLTEGDVTRIRNRIEDARKQPKDRPPIKKLIFDFNPNKAASGTSNFYVCLHFADYLLELESDLHFHTIAYVHNEVTGHTVLPVLACMTRVLSEKGEIGDVWQGQPERNTQTVRLHYQRIAQVRFPQGPDLVLKMLDKDMGILKGKTRDNQVHYIGYTRGNRQQRLQEAQDKLGFHDVADAEGLQPGISRYSASLALSYGLCRDPLINSRERVAREYGLSRLRLREDVLQGQPVHPWLIDFAGPVTSAKVNSIQRKISKAISKGGNFFILQLDCESGDTLAASELAKYLRNLKDDKGVRPVQTVAFIPPKHSLGAATAIALGCNEIVMARDAILGDFTYLKAEDLPKQALMRKALVELAREQGYPSLLIQGTLDPDLVIYLVKSKADPTYHFPVSEEEFATDQKSPHPTLDRENVLKNKGELLKLDAAKAERFGLACCQVDDLQGVYDHYGLKREDVRQAGSDMLDEIETFFRNPFVRILLVMIGIVGLILEMKMPGVGLPGVVAAVCFVLFFWAHSGVGHFTWLAILLFVLGLVLIGLEVFFLPGMAVFGISGVVLVVASLVLVTLEKAPSTSEDWWNLGKTLTTYTFTLIGAITAAFLIARYLPQIPYANRLVLTPPSDDKPEAGEDDNRGRQPGGAERYGALLGAIGEAATPLRPSGKARFGEEYLDVIAEGSYVNAGTRVQVIEIEGNRIVVKEV